MLMMHVVSGAHIGGNCVGHVIEIRWSELGHRIELRLGKFLSNETVV